MQLSNERFDKLFTSPLARATETADIIWQDTEGPRAVLPSLREIDLYSFQGLLKADGIAQYGSEFKTWQQKPADFEIDGRQPVVELWHRASMAWQEILLDDEVQSCALVVAHNAVNQALVGTAAGIGPEFFRRLLQSNAASTVLDFVPRQSGGPPVVTIDRLNQVLQTTQPPTCRTPHSHPTHPPLGTGRAFQQASVTTSRPGRSRVLSRPCWHARGRHGDRCRGSAPLPNPSAGHHTADTPHAVVADRTHRLT